MLEFLDYVYIFILIIVVVVLKDLFVYVFFKQDNKKIERLVNHRPRKSKNVLEEFFSTDNQTNCDKIKDLLNKFEFQDLEGMRTLVLHCPLHFNMSPGMDILKVSNLYVNNIHCRGDGNVINLETNLNGNGNTIGAYYLKCRDFRPIDDSTGGFSGFTDDQEKLGNIYIFANLNADPNKGYITIDSHVDMSEYTIGAYRLKVTDIRPVNDSIGGFSFENEDPALRDNIFLFGKLHFNLVGRNEHDTYSSAKQIEFTERVYCHKMLYANTNQESNNDKLIVYTGNGGSYFYVNGNNDFGVYSNSTPSAPRNTTSCNPNNTRNQCNS